MDRITLSVAVDHAPTFLVTPGLVVRSLGTPSDRIVTVYPAALLKETGTITGERDIGDLGQHGGGSLGCWAITDVLLYDTVQLTHNLFLVK